MNRWRRAIATLTAATLVAASLFPGPAAAVDRSTEWRSRAVAALDAFAAADDGNQSAFSYAFVAQTVAWLYGWDDPRVDTYLAEVYERRNPDGGWGLNASHDWLGDGTVNPVDTTYTITIAGHVGPVLLEAHKAGKVPYVDVKSIVDLLMTSPRVTAYGTATGQCIAYSRSGNDSGFCVHNVNASVAWFLVAADAAGVQATGLTLLVVDILRREVANYIPGTMWWKYRDTTSLNDADHNSYMGETLYDLIPKIGATVAWNHMTHEFADNAVSPLAHARLTSLAARPGHMHPSGTTWWCVLGDDWMGEFDAFVATAPPGRLAQAAYYAARASLAC